MATMCSTCVLFPNVLQTYAVNDVSFHNGWGTFATCGSDGAYNFWDKESRQRLKGFSRCNNSISCGKFNTSGTVHIHILLYSYIYQIYAYAVSYDWSKGVEQYKQTEPNYVFYILHTLSNSFQIDLDVIQFQVACNVRPALSANAHAGDPHRIVRACQCPRPRRPGRRRSHQEVPSVHRG